MIIYMQIYIVSVIYIIAIKTIRSVFSAWKQYATEKYSTNSKLSSGRTTERREAFKSTVKLLHTAFLWLLKIFSLQVSP